MHYFFQDMHNFAVNKSTAKNCMSLAAKAVKL